MERMPVDSHSPLLSFPAPLTGTEDAEPAVLKVDGLKKRYRSIEAVAGLSFEIRAGEIFGLLGPNGAGKTTTISILATARKPSGGDATLLGHSISREPDVVRRMIGVVPQEISLYPMLTAQENLAFFGSLYDVKGPQLESRIDELLRFVGLSGRRNDYVSTFSGGMKRRLNIALALVHKPKLILLDEPTVGVDAQSREHIFEILRQLREEGHAILYTTHYMEEAQELCDRLAIVSHGKIIAAGTFDELLRHLDCAETVEIRGLPHGTDLAAIKAAGGVCDIQSDDGVVKLFVQSATRLLGPLHKVISSSTKPVRVRIEPLSLEDVFLQLTGKELRD
jgi:ABC-2 type transport system ATP-binding protein